MSPVLTPPGKLKMLLKDLPPDKLREVIDFAEFLKTKDGKKAAAARMKKHIKLPTFHLGHMAQDVLNRDQLYGEYLEHKLG